MRKGGVMPVRGTTAWRHAIIEKKIINRDEGGNGRVTSSGTHYVMCAYSYCENDASTLYEVRVNTHAEGYEERIMHYAFCSEKCKSRWLDELTRMRHNAEI
jgi:hypothetical protein